MLDKGKSLIWNVDGKFIEQSWQDLKEKILYTHGGLGIIAADFVELLSYDPNIRESLHKRRMAFAAITANAVQEEDIELLAKIFTIMNLTPLNFEREWFIYFLRKASDLEEFDVSRAVLVINELYEINARNAHMLILALGDYVTETPQGKKIISSLLRETELLRKELL